MRKMIVMRKMRVKRRMRVTRRMRLTRRKREWTKGSIGRIHVNEMKKYRGSLDTFSILKVSEIKM